MISTQGRQRVAAVLVGLVAMALLIPLSPLPHDASAASAPNAEVSASAVQNRVLWQGKQTFLAGANVPWLDSRCDIGCGASGGVSSRAKEVRRVFESMARKGVRTVRWYAFPGDAWQVSRAGGQPGQLRSGVYADMDFLSGVAKEYDMYLDMVLFTSPAKLPSGWVNSAAGRNRLADSLRPLFARYANNSHIVAWDIFDAPEDAIDAGKVEGNHVAALAKRIAATVHASSPTRVTLTARGLSDLSRWSTVGLDFYSARWLNSPRSGKNCATCRSASDVRAAEGVSGPIVISALGTGSRANAKRSYGDLQAKGYAGFLIWAQRQVAAPGVSFKGSVNRQATRWFVYKRSYAGPRAHVLNPCWGTGAHRLRCPDLKITRPYGLRLDRKGGRQLLRAGNRLHSMGPGPVEVYGKRTGSRTMKARQQIVKKSGGRLHLPYRARLKFKAVPGQGSYWKFEHAAKFELWRLNSSGLATELVRVGPKVIYCLRDLKRMNPWVKGSPGSRIYPGCNQSSSKRAVRLGVSPGWTDDYPPSYNEQWIDVTGLRGCFAYTQIVDPKNHIFEKNEKNNRATAVVKLPYNGKQGQCRGKSGAGGAGGGY